MGSNISFSVKKTPQVVWKMPKNSKGMVFLPPFDPTAMSVADLQDVTKTFFREAWGEIIEIVYETRANNMVNRGCIWPANSERTRTTMDGY